MGNTSELKNNTHDANQPKGGRLSEGGRPVPHGQGPPWTRTDRASNFREPIGKLFKYMGSYKWMIFAGVVCVMMGSILLTIGPQLLKEISDAIYDGIGGTMDTDHIEYLALLTVALYASAVLFNSIEHAIIPIVSEKVAYKLRRDLIHKINRLPLNYYDNSSTGDMMSRLTNDADIVGTHSGIAFSMLASAMTTFVGSIVMMFYTNVTLALVCVIPPLFGFVFMRLIMLRTQKYYLQQSKDLGAMNGLVEEVYYGHNIVSAYGNEEDCRERFVKINDNLFQSNYVTRFITSSIPQLMGFINNLGYVLVCVMGSMMIISGEITYGVIVAFIVYVRMFSFPLMQISDAIASLQSLAASSERIFELINAPEMEDESEKISDIGEVQGVVEFRDVSFSYIEGKEIIHHFSMEVKAGEKVAIVGPTGAGKTTIVNLLMRFYEVDSGDIIIDGTSTKEMRRDRIHRMFSMVLQDPWLFNGTVRENLIFNKENVSQETIEEACRSVGIHDYIMSLPKGYDTVLNDSASMSAGQKQQMTIARTIIADSPMIIFDEATSSVDTRTEKHIQAALGEMTRGRTSFIIAHRLSTIINCDKIIVMRDGRIAETGTHQELLSKGGFYAELYNSQFENCD